MKLVQETVTELDDEQSEPSFINSAQDTNIDAIFNHDRQQKKSLDGQEPSQKLCENLPKHVTFFFFFLKIQCLNKNKKKKWNESGMLIEFHACPFG